MHGVICGSGLAMHCSIHVLYLFLYNSFVREIKLHAIMWNKLSETCLKLGLTLFVANLFVEMNGFVSRTHLQMLACQGPK